MSRKKKDLDAAPKGLGRGKYPRKAKDAAVGSDVPVAPTEAPTEAPTKKLKGKAARLAAANPFSEFVNPCIANIIVTLNGGILCVAEFADIAQVTDPAVQEAFKNGVYKLINYKHPNGTAELAVKLLKVLNRDEHATVVGINLTHAKRNTIFTALANETFVL